MKTPEKPEHASSSEDAAYERLIEAERAELADDARARVWARVSGELAQTASSPRVQARAPARSSAGLDWFVGGLVAAAAALFFVVSLGLNGELGHGIAGGEGKLDVEALIAQLGAEDFAMRQAAYRKLILGGAAVKQAVTKRKATGDPELDAGIVRLRDAFALAERLPAAAQFDSVAFWNVLWQREAESQPGVWSLGISLHPETPQPACPPSAMLGDALAAAYGEARAKTAGEGFRRAYDALRGFQAWDRAGGLTSGEEAAHAERERRFDALLKAVEQAGPAAAPVILKVLEMPLPAVVMTDHPPGHVDPLPLDHLRMMAAADALKLREAEPILVDRFVRDGYPLSATIHAHAVQLLWRLGGRLDKAPVFPFDIGALDQGKVGEVLTWWTAKRVQEMVPLLSSEEFQVREEAERALSALGEEALPALDALPSEAEPEVAARLKRVRLALIPGPERARTLDEALALRRQYVEEATREDKINDAAHVARYIDLALRALERVRALAPQSDRDLVCADLLFESGMAHYNRFKKGTGSTNAVLKRARYDLSMAIDLYEKVVKREPDNKAVENKLTEASMIHYATSKYETLDAEN
ncbi:MAG: hypothetical protein HS116_24720 [Planctomycetes bacterium]|nr:hypothetical protein [Planctomycetota bacterium]